MVVEICLNFSCIVLNQRVGFLDLKCLALDGGFPHNKITHEILLGHSGNLDLFHHRMSALPCRTYKPGGYNNGNTNGDAAQELRFHTQPSEFVAVMQTVRLPVLTTKL